MAADCRRHHARSGAGVPLTVLIDCLRISWVRPPPKRNYVRILAGKPLAIALAMTPRIRVGVACPLSAERAAFMEWLEGANYEAVQMLSLTSIVSTLETKPVEVLIADIKIFSNDTCRS